ncbi:glycoside hydrolase family 26 protein [Paenibacillus spongiae]|uniref:Glycoside hydrolase family 26 protein n=1 Tax=Paenibacillus spongiae TaxID=2909671 RepID=A0ABY5S978_9BACL|nr:glycoside hydrolase family 26 protein [Paenibacillus spongiae]UVI30224.1 glycoside hydrolase family 26 protein [Paenibacillus spongiae]
MQKNYEDAIHNGSRFQAEPKLINANATDNAKRLMAYLCDIYGRRILAGQQIGVNTMPEIDMIYEQTGKRPAVCGFDFMNDSPSRVERGTVGQDTDLAIQWGKDGGIVTFCWHWNAPKELIDQAPDRFWHSGFYTNATTFDLEQAMNDPSSEAYRLLIRDIDAISGLLKRLQDEDIPVLWRPLHEASGAWFWWGAKGPEPCIKLWKLMYERMTHYHRLNHLIWVWNGQHRDWYPGDEYVDIIGEDVYGPARDYSSQAERFNTAISYSTEADKIVALSENGPIPDPDQLVQDGIPWAWFCTWYGDFIWKKDQDRIVYSEEYTEAFMLNKMYNHPYVITKELLPDLRSYRLEE